MSMNKSTITPGNGEFVWDTSDNTTDEVDLATLMDLGLLNGTPKQVVIYFDLKAFADDAAVWTALTIRVYAKVDGTNFRLLDEDEYSKVEITAVPIMAGYIFDTGRDAKITLQLDVALDDDQTVYYSSMTGWLV